MRSDYTQTILSQPHSLQRSAEHVRSQLADADPVPWLEGTLGVVGMGASAHAAHLMVDVMQRHGRRAVALSASDVMSADLAPQADCYVVVSESGSSVETVHAAQCLQRFPLLGVTNAPGSPLTEMVNLSVDLGCGTDSAVYTIGYTATLQAFALLADWLGVTGPDTDISGLPPLSKQLLAPDEDMTGWAQSTADARSVDVIGHGSHYCSAGEAALMVREVCRMPASCHDTFEYLHGPMEWLDTRSLCILFGSGREIELAEFIASTGAAVLLITSSTVSPDAVHTIRIPGVGPCATAVLEMLPIHLLLKVMGEHHGLTIDGFRYHQHDTKLSEQY